MRRDDQGHPALGFSVLKNLGLTLLLVAFENLLIFASPGFSSSGTSGGDLIGPVPGWFIGLVWTALFAGLGVVRGVMVAEGSPAARRASRAVAILLSAAPACDRAGGCDRLDRICHYGLDK